MDEDIEKQDRNVMRQNSSSDELDHAVDAALAKYAAVEPRAGLEERVLANLRAEHGRRVNRGWWRWGLGATAVAVVVLAIDVTWRSGRSSQPTVANRRSLVKQDLPKPGTQIAAQDDNRSRPRHPHRSAKAHPVHSAVVIAASPKLDQFPSPQPLSEQERILASYVSEYPEHAALIAEARMEMLRRDQEEELQQASADGNGDSLP
jgi:hypothetical protein